MNRARRTGRIFALGAAGLFLASLLVAVAALRGLLGEGPAIPLLLYFGLYLLIDPLEHWADREGVKRDAELVEQLRARRTNKRRAAVRQGLRGS